MAQRCSRQAWIMSSSLSMAGRAREADVVPPLEPSLLQIDNSDWRCHQVQLSKLCCVVSATGSSVKRLSSRISANSGHNAMLGNRTLK